MTQRLQTELYDQYARFNPPIDELERELEEVGAEDQRLRWAAVKSSAADVLDNEDAIDAASERVRNAKVRLAEANEALLVARPKVTFADCWRAMKNS
jgi:hypothetical protein